MANAPWVKLALQLNGAGGATPISLSEPLPSQGAPLWIHLDYTFDEAYAWLESRLDVPNTVVEALFATDTRPRAADVGGGLLIYLRGVNLAPGARPEDMIAVRLWIRNGLIISTQKRQLLTLSEIATELEQGEGARTPSDLVKRLVDGLIWRMEDVIERIEDQVGDCAEMLESKPDKALTHEISRLRRRVVTLRRYLAPQREAIARLQNDARIDREDAEIIREAGERLQRLLEDLDAARDHATLLQEEVFSVQNEAINDRMYLLAIISALFLPLAFLTGLFGINVGGLPGLDDPNAFWWFSGSLVVIATGILVWMARRRWF
ncbi:MAG: zinc transporter ZntB [Alloalcanivorax venustensis]|jgi:zinc transporter|uniref:zinc transporter ZntB n=1 Tax=Alloalcanivorax venustensis TaxID=172371 RepID=UPI00329A486A